MEFTLKINMDNVAFDESGAELEELLNRIALSVGNGRQSGKVLDSNGNRVGGWDIVDN